MNVIEIEEALSELAQASFNPEAFIWEFMASYGAPKSTIARLQTGDGNTSDVPGGVIWRKWLHFKACQIGQTTQALDALESSKKVAKAKVRYILTTDGDEFAARDLASGESLFCDLSALGDHFGFFLPIAGIDRYQVADENPIDIKATGRLAKLYDALIADNPDWKTDVRRHELNQFMTRIIFCFFAEDTGIFPDQLFSKTIKERSGSDHRLVSPTLEMMFEIMSINDKDGSRAGKPNWACAFPYVNGGLFSGTYVSPTFGRASLRYLLEAGKLDWKLINPDIFGSMIQSIANDDERGELGMHYTSVPNILKVLNPLFLDGLRAEVEASWSNRKALQNVLKRLMRIRVFDPACGSGNFLVIAYRELRRIEIDVLSRLSDLIGSPPGFWSHVQLRNFYGIELKDFAAETAKLSLWIAEFQSNKLYEHEIGKLLPSLPLQEGGSIVCGNALELNWISVCPVAQDPEAETYVCGNPPYLGSVYQTEKQKKDMDLVMAGRMSSYKDLDYVSTWIVKWIDFSESVKSDCAFVSTNSISQGEQVAMLWDYVFGAGASIFFAHRSFRWTNNASANAGVTCVIVGLTFDEGRSKTIYDQGYSGSAENIAPYLIDGPNVVVRKRSKPLSEVFRMHRGNQPTDGGNLLLNDLEREQLLEKCPQVEPLIKKYVGSQEFIRGESRWCLWISDDLLPIAQNCSEISRRIEAVHELRKNSKGKQANDNAKTPHRFAVVSGVASESSIVVPKVSSERRYYLPVGIVDSQSIISDLAFAIYDAPMWHLSIVASRLHLIWISTVCGKLETRYRYSNTLGWNTFPMPRLSESDQAELAQRAEGILLARAAHFDKTIAQLYDPNKMPLDLLEAHRANDETLEKIYIGRTFKNDTERLERLFKLYVKMVGSKVPA